MKHKFTIITSGVVAIAILFLTVLNRSADAQESAKSEPTTPSEIDFPMGFDGKIARKQFAVWGTVNQDGSIRTLGPKKPGPDQDIWRSVRISPGVYRIEIIDAFIGNPVVNVTALPNTENPDRIPTIVSATKKFIEIRIWDVSEEQTEDTHFMFFAIASLEDADK